MAPVNRRGFLGLSAAVALAPLACPVASAAGTVQAFDTRHAAGPGWYQDAFAAGYRLMVFSSNAWGRNQPSAATSGVLGMALDAGLRVAAYTRNPNWWRAGIEACGPHVGALSFFALDIETSPGVPVTRSMVDGVRGMGVQPVIYSGAHMWPAIMGNDTSFSDIPLWDARHGGGGFVPYGGWSGPVGTQLTEESSLNGVPIDIDSFSASFLGL